MATGFFGQGWGELKRKAERRQLRKRLMEHQRNRQLRLGELGEVAWKEGVVPPGQEALRAQLTELEGKAGELDASGTALARQGSELEERRRSEAAKYDDQRTQAEAAKKPVDAALAEARNRQAQRESERSKAQARLSALAQENEQLRARAAELSGGAAGPEREAQIAAARARMDAIGVEQPQTAAELERASAALPALAEETGKLEAQAQEHARKLEQIAAERQRVLEQMDAELRTLRQQQQSTAAASEGVQHARRQRYEQLGEALYQGGEKDPRLAGAMAAVKSEEASAASTQGALEASLAQTRALPAHTMTKFTAAVLGIVLLVIAIPVGGAAAWRWWQARGAATEQAWFDEEQGESVNPYLHHALAGSPAYMMADALAAAQDQKMAETILVEVFRLIGLGVYTHEGQPVLRGGERSAQDFFLYDFHLRLLARTQVVPSSLDFDTLAWVVGKEVAELEKPEEMRAILAEAIARRYREAQQAPYEQHSFIVLFLDGLARRQAQPYSLNDLKQHNRRLTPVQTLLLMMEFLLPAPQEQAAAPAAPFWRLTPAAQAQSPCDLIKGDGQDYFGTGSGYVVELAEKAGGITGKIANFLGNLTGVIGAIGDVLTLTGIDIHVQPQPYGIHLRHGDTALAGIVTTVTFDAEFVSDDTLKCGWLAGKTMMVKGPVPGVLLQWDFYPKLPWPLRMHEATELAFHTGLWTQTDASGMSTFILEPSNCPDWKACQGGGRCKTENRGYMAEVSARIVTADIPLPSLSAGPLSLLLKFGPGTVEYLMRGRKGHSRFLAEWHRKLPDDQYEDPRKRPPNDPRRRQ